MLSRTIRTEFWFKLFILLHLIGWTLAPILVRTNLPMDAIEGSTWGQQLEWGYDKNPYLNAWLTAFANYLDGHSEWMIYFFSQLSVILCFWAVWQLGKKFLPPLYALIAVLLLEVIQYYNFHAIDFNDNTLELSLWALGIYSFYQALAGGKLSKLFYWILTGLFLGLGLMAKYYTGVLITCMAVFLFSEKEARQQLLTPWPYAGLITFLLIIAPHIYWLPQHDYITIQYVFERTQSIPTWTNHLLFPAEFAWQQFQVFLPALILFALIFLRKKSDPAKDNDFHIKTYDKKFLFYVGLGPFLLTLLLSFLLGIKLRAGWGMPLLSFWGIILLCICKPEITVKKYYQFIATIFVLFILFLSGYAFSLMHATEPSSANFPGQQLAQTMTQQWREKYGTQLSYVAGSRWLSGNISFYSKDHPQVFIAWDKMRSPWIDVKKLQQKGGIFIWDISKQEELPAEIKKQFPQLEKSSIMEFSWQRSKNQLPPIKIGWAILPPQS